ncbi:hypothetical protein FEI13_18610 [Halomonas urmiana]|uniref:HNH endonuclease n=1 Tax=Halomonas urmiana TaxID=490901 RepID=A0A5R8M5H8_9GAMM|nr:hypothetical protein [Halomonas urmiana]TLF44793.1 hypothetical protein FEI13_18610 [Halomonas urmiana]
MNGICALCTKDRKLRGSHFMPKAVYRSLSKGFPDHGENIVLISGGDKSAAYSDKQAKKHLLCESCESMFSKYGEDKVISLMARPGGFKLATKIRKFKELSRLNDEAWYFPPGEGLAFNFMYFAVSIAWRLSSADWTSYGLSETKNSLWLENMDSFSEFLLGGSEIPENTYLAVYVDNQTVDTPLMSFPTFKDHASYQHVVFEIPGIKFSLVAGKNPGEGVREIYSVNKTNVYFVSRNLKSHPDYQFMVNFLKHEAIAKARLAKELGITV